MVNKILNYGFAWLTVIIALILSLKFITSTLRQQSNKLKALDKKLGKSHILLGQLLIVTGLVHGYFSSENLLSFNIGTITWLLSVLLALSFIGRKFLKGKFSWLWVHKILTVVFLVFIIWHVIDVGGIRVLDELFNDKITKIDETISEESKTVEQLNKGMESLVYKDGTYTGVADGFGSGLTVSVEVKDNQIQNIIILNHNERQAKYYERPIEEVPKEIVETQSLDVDTVSGATFTSIGIINAVNNALSQGLVSGELPEIRELPARKHGRG